MYIPMYLPTYIDMSFIIKILVGILCIYIYIIIVSTRTIQYYNKK